MKKIVIGLVIGAALASGQFKVWVKTNPFETMTAEQRKEFGIDKMNAAALSHFKDWTAAYAVTVADSLLYETGRAHEKQIASGRERGK